VTDWLFSVKIILTLTLKYFHGEWRIRVTVSMDFHGNGIRYLSPTRKEQYTSGTCCVVGYVVGYLGLGLGLGLGWVRVRVRVRFSRLGIVPFV